jgi:hypothetical protein
VKGKRDGSDEVKGKSSDEVKGKSSDEVKGKSMDEKVFGSLAVMTHVQWWYEQALGELPLPPAVSSDCAVTDPSGERNLAESLRSGNGEGRRRRGGGNGAAGVGKTLTVGTRVLAEWSGDMLYYAGTIEQANVDGTCAVHMHTHMHSYRWFLHRYLRSPV